MAENDSNRSSGASNSGNISQAVKVDVGSAGQGRWYLTKDVLIPVIVALVSAVGGGYIKQQFDLSTAPEKTKAETQTLLGLAKEIESLATANQVSAEVIDKVKQLAVQARAIEVTASHLQGPRGSITQDVDFWLRQNTTAILGGAIVRSKCRLLRYSENYRQWYPKKLASRSQG